MCFVDDDAFATKLDPFNAFAWAQKQNRDRLKNQISTIWKNKMPRRKSIIPSSSKAIILLSTNRSDWLVLSAFNFVRTCCDPWSWHFILLKHGSFESNFPGIPFREKACCLKILCTTSIQLCSLCCLYWSHCWTRSNWSNYFPLSQSMKFLREICFSKHASTLGGFLCI